MKTVRERHSLFIRDNLISIATRNMLHFRLSPNTLYNVAPVVAGAFAVSLIVLC